MSSPVDSSQPDSGPQRRCRDQIRACIAERFAGDGGDEIEQLVIGVLEAQGYETRIESSRGLIFARDSHGPFRPRLIVQVAPSARPVQISDLQALNEALKDTVGADQGLLVAWGGVDHIAEQEIPHQFLRFRVWDSEHLLDAVLRSYDALSEELRTSLPLKRVC